MVREMQLSAGESRSLRELWCILVQNSADILWIFGGPLVLLCGFGRNSRNVFVQFLCKILRNLRMRESGIWCVLREILRMLVFHCEAIREVCGRYCGENLRLVG